MKEATAFVQTVEVESLSLKQLGAHVQQLCRQSAASLWAIGKALVVARQHIEAKDWKKWLKENCPGMTYPTLMRYMLLAKKNPKAKGIDAQTITESYRKLGITNANKSREAKRDALKVAETVALKLNNIVKDKEAVALVKQLLKQIEILNPSKKADVK